MKKLVLTIIILMNFNLQADSGSGGTTGGHPMPVVAVPFNADQARAQKLYDAVVWIKQQVPKGCLPKDFKNAILAELEELLYSKQIYFFPDSTMLGAGRYCGDYGNKALPNGNHEFYKVGAFTQKNKQTPVYFTKESEQFDAQELALTFVQELNDHILQWNSEEYLNSLGEMLVQSEVCKKDEYGANDVFSQFPDSNPEFVNLQSEFFADVERKLKKDGKYNFGNLFVFKKYQKTNYGFNFIPSEFFVYRNGQKELFSAKGEAQFEVVFNPFVYVKLKYLAEPTDALSGYVKEVKTGTIVTEFIYSPKWEDPARNQDRFNADPLCDSREFDSNNSIRWKLYRWGNGDSQAKTCEVKIEQDKVYVQINRDLLSICKENLNLDYFNRTKIIDDFAPETFCQAEAYTKRDSVFSRQNYQRILAGNDPKEFVRKLISLNENYYRQKYSLSASVKLPWISKNILGGRLEMLSDLIAVSKTIQGDIYSVYVTTKGISKAENKAEEFDNDDDDMAYQCFFQGVNAGKCDILDHDE
jgi:hypothetical protein